MIIFAISCSSGEYNQNLEFYDHVVCYHQSFETAKTKVYKIAKQYYMKNFDLFENSKQDYFRLVDNNTGDSIQIDTIEVLP